MDAEAFLTGLRWDSVTYPLDILAKASFTAFSMLGFSHLSP
ncbi:hypothetical protein HMPREF1522_0006 [Actinomyces sp. ICM54]|nr:hypothetical protein HMPREF1522_0006 [Actinomyces sp. ICM54]